MKKYRLILAYLIIGCMISCSSNSGDDDAAGTPDPGGVDRSANLLATGASANDILSNDNFDRLVIEIGFVAGFRPTTAAMTEFEEYLRERTFKEDIEIIFNEIPSPAEEALELQEIADFETQHRTAYNDGSTIAIYIFFADAPADSDDNENGLVTLGAVYRNTSMVIYESTIRRLSDRSSLVTTADVEAATLNHEFGHLFGLVNLGTPVVNDHEDPEAQNHCVINPCLMRAELSFGSSAMKMLSDIAAKGGAAPELDAECILDLQANGGR